MFHSINLGRRIAFANLARRASAVASILFVTIIPLRSRAQFVPHVDVTSPQFGKPSGCPNAADPNGTLDSSCAFQAAINYAISTAGSGQYGGQYPEVYIPIGKFLIGTGLGSGLTVGSNVSIVGDPGAVVTDAAGNFDLFTITGNNVTVKGFTLVGEGTTTGVSLNTVSIASNGTASVTTTAALPSNFIPGSVVAFSGTGTGLDTTARVITGTGPSSFTVNTTIYTGSLTSTTGSVTGGYSQNGITVNGASNIDISEMTISGFSGAAGVYLTSATGAKVHNNIINNLYISDGIYGTNNSSNILVDGNMVDRSLGQIWGHAIAFHSATANDTVSQITVTNNNIENGYSFCFEIGEFYGNLPTGLVLSGNNCNQHTWSTTLGQQAGGWSLSGVDGGTITNNVYTNFTGQRAYACIEAVGGTRQQISNNTCYGGTVGLIENPYSTFTGNYVAPLYPKTSGTNTALYVGGSNPHMNSDYEVISNNTLDRTGANGQTSWIPPIGSLLSISTSSIGGCTVTGSPGQTVLLTSFPGITGATATVTLSATVTAGALSSSNVGSIAITNAGTGATTSPTSATCSAGTATSASGTASFTSSLTGTLASIPVSSIGGCTVTGTLGQTVLLNGFNNDPLEQFHHSCTQLRVSRNQACAFSADIS